MTISAMNRRMIDGLDIHVANASGLSGRKRWMVGQDGEKGC